jgi:hypothetical protein
MLKKFVKGLTRLWSTRKFYSGVKGLIIFFAFGNFLNKKINKEKLKLQFLAS